MTDNEPPYRATIKPDPRLPLIDDLVEVVGHMLAAQEAMAEEAHYNFVKRHGPDMTNKSIQDMNRHLAQARSEYNDTRAKWEGDKEMQRHE